MREIIVNVFAGILRLAGLLLYGTWWIVKIIAFSALGILYSFAMTTFMRRHNNCGDESPFCCLVGNMAIMFTFIFFLDLTIPLAGGGHLLTKLWLASNLLSFIYELGRWKRSKNQPSPG